MGSFCKSNEGEYTIAQYIRPFTSPITILFHHHWQKSFSQLMTMLVRDINVALTPYHLYRNSYSIEHSHKGARSLMYTIRMWLLNPHCLIQNIKYHIPYYASCLFLYVIRVKLVAVCKHSRVNPHSCKIQSLVQLQLLNSLSL